MTPRGFRSSYDWNRLSRRLWYGFLESVHGIGDVDGVIHDSVYERVIHERDSLSARYHFDRTFRTFFTEKVVYTSIVSFFCIFLVSFVLQ